MVIYTYEPRNKTAMKYSSKPTSSNNNKKKNKKNNKSKEVAGWDDIPDYAPPTPTPPPSPEQDATEPESEPIPQHGKWVHGTIPMSTIRKMKWGDIDNLTDEEFGYYQEPN